MDPDVEDAAGEPATKLEGWPPTAAAAAVGRLPTAAIPRGERAATLLSLAPRGPPPPPPADRA